MDNMTKSKLMIFCQDGDINAVKRILLKNPSLINLQDSYGCSLLCLSLKQNCFKLVELLVNLKADINLPNTVIK